MVGAAELSALSERLEEAGKAGDTETIRQNTGTLLEKYGAYKEALRDLEAADPAAEKKEDKPMIDADTLADAWEALKDMAEGMDYDSAEMVLESLRDYRMEEADEKAFRQIGVYLKALDWKRISEIVNEHRG